MFFRQISLLVFSFLWANSVISQAESLLEQYPLQAPGMRKAILSNAEDILSRCREILRLESDAISLEDRISVMTLAGYSYAQLGFADSARNMLRWVEQDDADHYLYPQKMISYLAEGSLLIRASECLEGYKILHEAQKIAIAHEDIYHTHYINTIKGVSLHLRGIEDQAFSLMRDGIQELHQSGFEKEALEFENNLAALLIRSGYYQEALELLEAAATRSGPETSPDFATYLWLNRGLAKFMADRYDLDDILRDVQTGISQAEELNFTIGKLFGYSVKADVLSALGRWEEAEEALAHFLDPEFEPIFNSQNDLSSYTNLVYGKISENQQNWEAARLAYNWAITHTSPGSRFPDYETGFQGLHRIALATGDQEEAARIFQRLSHLKDSLFEEKNQANLDLIEAKRELSEKDQLITEAEQQLEIQALSRRLLIGVMILAILVSLILFLAYRNRTIQKDKEKTEKVNHQLESYTNELEELAFVVSHNLRESARNISTFTGLFTRNSKDQLHGKSLQYLGHMQAASLRTSAMLSDLETYVGVGKHLGDPLPLPLNSLLEELLDETSLSGIKDQVVIGSLPVIKAHPSMMRLIFHQLLDNADKFRNPDKPLAVRVHFEKLPDRFCIHVDDNGIGFDPTYKETIFRVFQRLHDQEEIDGTGIGLAIVDKAVRYYGGEIEVESTLGQGSQFTVCFPLRMLVSEG